MELCTGILFFGIVCQVVLFLFVPGRSDYSIGLWMGILLSLAGSVHMWWALDKALDYGDGARNMMTKHSLLRYGVVVVVLGIIMVTGVANPLMAFLGYMGMKVAAYLQPYTHKLFSKFLNKDGNDK